MPPLSPSNPLRVHFQHVCRLPYNSATRTLYRRHLSTVVDTPSSSSPPPSVKRSYTFLTHRRLLSLTGPDAANFLQGLTTTNIPSSLQSQGGSGFYSAFLNAAGRVLYDVFIYPTMGSELARKERGEESGFLIEVDAKEAQALAGHLKKFRLRRKVEVALLDGHSDNKNNGWGVYAVWGDQQSQEIQEEDKTSEEPRKEGHIGCPDDRAPGFGYRRVLPHPPQHSEFDAGEVPLENYHLRRILHGVPEGQTEIPKDTALPLESNLDIMGGIDFRKGCYVGQELTIRTHHTGVVRKRILPVVVYRHGETIPESLRIEGGGDGITLPPAGANITRVAGGKGRSVGRWGGGIGRVGLALGRLEVMTDSVVGGSSLWKPGEEFRIAWEEGEVLVKAFVPDWFQARAERLRVRHGV